MKRILYAIGLIITAVGLGTSCQSAVETCGEGEEVDLPEGSVCVYDEEIVIETGFSCPADKPFIHGGEGHFVCSEGKELTPDDISRINEELGQGEDFRTPEGGSIGSDDPGWGVSENQRAADVLFVIDDSGSMCQEQEALSAELNSFVRRLDLAKVDLQVGVTSTHQTPEGVNPVLFGERDFGALRNRPYAVPASVAGCGTPAAIESMLERAVACTTNPSAHRTKLTAGESACLDDSNSSDCQTYCADNADESWCRMDGSVFEFERREFYNSLAPDDADYRELPRVLKASDYRNSDGSLRSGDFVRDLRCISMVGVDGWGIEKGLGAAVRAVSPEMTSGEDAPNAGFIRRDARFGVIFVSDENDCTHDGGIDETGVGACFNDVCEFENSTQLSEEESALVPLGDLKSDLLTNLRTIKNRANFTEEDVFVAGIYGLPDRYEGRRYSADECADPGYNNVQPGCSNPVFGTAFSGDRYDRFLQQFPNRFPEPNDPNVGKICLPDELSSTMSSIAERLGSWETTTEQ